MRHMQELLTPLQAAMSAVQSHSPQQQMQSPGQTYQVKLTMPQQQMLWQAAMSVVLLLMQPTQ